MQMWRVHGDVNGECISCIQKNESAGQTHFDSLRSSLRHSMTIYEYDKKGRLVDLEKSYTGQAGSVVTTHEGECRLYTARHNVSNSTTKDGNFMSFRPPAFVLRSADGETVTKTGVAFKQENRDFSKKKGGMLLSNNVEWSKGSDITYGVVNPKPLLWKRSIRPDPSPWWKFWVKRACSFSDDVINRCAFHQVRKDFQLEVSQHIAIIVSTVSFDCGATTDNVLPNLECFKNQQYSKDENKNMYGPYGGFSIYTGSIKAVGSHHIEHDINTYGGCSGVIVFLLDSSLGQPVSVQREDLGKAIAVHVGYSIK